MANNKKGNRRNILLRNVARNVDGIWVATCLELGIVITSPKAESIKKKMSYAIDLYLEGIAESIEQGHKFQMTPVAGYWYKKRLFDIRMWYTKLSKRKDPSSNHDESDFNMWLGRNIVLC